MTVERSIILGLIASSSSVCWPMVLKSFFALDAERLSLRDKRLICLSVDQQVTTMAGFRMRKSILCKLFSHSWEEMGLDRRRCIHCDEIEYRVLKKNCNPEDRKYVWSKKRDIAESVDSSS
jgi:hypothetical protein